MSFSSSPQSLSELSALPRRDLQKLAKRADVVAWATAARGAPLKATAKSAELVEAIWECFQASAGAAASEPQQIEAPAEAAAAAAAAAEEAMSDAPAAATTESVAIEQTEEEVECIPAPILAPSSPVADSAEAAAAAVDAEDAMVDSEADAVAEAAVEAAASAQEDAELRALEDDIAQLEGKLAEEPAAGSKKAKKSVAPAAVKKASKSTKKSLAPKKAVAVVAPAVVVPAPAAASAGLFSRKTIATKGKKVGASKVTAVLPSSDPAPSPSSLSSAFILPLSFPAPLPASSPAPSSTGSSDAYWSLMAELDKRVGEKKALEVVQRVVEEPTLVAANTAMATATKGKKTASKFDAIHQRAADKTESIVEYQARLERKKRETALATPLVGATAAKRPKHTVPAASPVAFNVAAAASSSVAAPFSMGPLSSPLSFSLGVTAAPAKTPGIAKRTRSSFKKDSERKAGAAASAKKILAAAKKVSAAAKKATPAPSTSLFSSKIPQRTASTTSVASATTTTFTQIACIEDVRSNASAAAPASAAAAKKKFDLSASLARPLTWKPHKGKVGKAASVAQAEGKENPAVAMEVSVEPAATKSDAFVFDCVPVFTAPLAANNSQPTASIASRKSMKHVRENVMTVKMGVEKGVKLNKLQASSASSRSKHIAVARSRAVVV